MAVGELTKRIAVATVGIPLALVLIYYGGFVLGAALAFFAAVGAAEFYQLSFARGEAPYAVSGMLASALAVLVAAWRPEAAAALPLIWTLLLLLFLTVAAAAIWTRGTDRRPLSAAAVTVTGMLYTGGTLCYALFLRHLVVVPSGAAAVTPAAIGLALLGFPVLLTWLNDTLAFFVGRRWGRKKLIPRVSPGKTVEGAVGGVAGTVLAGALYATFVLDAWLGVPLHPVAGALGGALVAAAAQVGDLAESLFKRSAGVKDSGHLFPGHGGVLDRFDALFFSLPIGYYFMLLSLPTLAGV